MSESNSPSSPFLPLSFQIILVFFAQKKKAEKSLSRMSDRGRDRSHARTLAHVRSLTLTNFFPFARKA
jgi:hypothetical protein